MRKLEASDVRELNLLKHYRLIRKWACRNNSLNDADLELLIYFDCMSLFSKQDFKVGTYAYSWDNRRWKRRNKIMRGETYTDKVLIAAIKNVNNDKTR